METSHHHHHQSSSERSHRKHSEHRRRQLRHAVRVGIGVFLVLSLVLVLVVLMAPGVLMRFASPEKDLGNGVLYSPTTNRHLRLDYDGIDVSRHQGEIDWPRVAQDTSVKFVYIKATEGSTIIDPYYHRNANGARRAKIAAGAYHYLTSKSPVRSQFRNFYSVVDRRRQDLVPMIDVEEDGLGGWSRQQVQDSLALMIQLIEEHYHCSPIIYSYAHFYNEILSPRFNSYLLFLARYNAHEPVVSGAGVHRIWQHYDRGVVDGISKPVDLNVFADGTSLKDIAMPTFD